MEVNSQIEVDNRIEEVDVRSFIIKCALDPPTYRFEAFKTALSFLDSSESSILGTVVTLNEFMGSYEERIRDPDKKTVLNRLRDILLGIKSLYYQRRELSTSFEVAWYEIEFIGRGLLGEVTSSIIDEIRTRGTERGDTSFAIGNQGRIEESVRLGVEGYIRDHRKVLYLYTLIPAIDAAMNNGRTASQREELDRIRGEAVNELEKFYSDHRIPAIPLATVIRDISEEYFRLVMLSGLNSILEQDGVIPHNREFRYYVLSLPSKAQSRFLAVMSSIRTFQKELTHAFDRPYRMIYLFSSGVAKLSTFVHRLKQRDYQVLVTDNMQTISVKGFVTEGGEFILMRSMDRKYIVLLERFNVCFDKTSGNLLLGSDGMPILYPRCKLYRVGDTLVPCSISDIEKLNHSAKPKRPKIC